MPKPVIINQSNIEYYRANKCLETTSVIWAIRDSLCPIALANLPNLKRLVCSGLDLTSIESVGICHKLEYIDCSNNKLPHLQGINGCFVLKVLICDNNLLINLNDLSWASNLRKVVCGQKTLESIEGIEFCTELRVFDCRGSSITSIRELGHTPSLLILMCSNCLISSFRGLDTCTRLREIYASGNRLPTLEGIQGCFSLVILDCRQNQLERVGQLTYLVRLADFKYGNNPIDPYYAQTKRILKKISRRSLDREYDEEAEQRERDKETPILNLIYEIVKGPKPTFSVSMLTNAGLERQALNPLLEYCNDDTAHPVYLLTFEEVFAYAWRVICTSGHKAKLFRKLADVIADEEYNYVMLDSKPPVTTKHYAIIAAIWSEIKLVCK